MPASSFLSAVRVPAMASIQHVCFLLPRIGLAKMYQKFVSGTYGYCPRALCDRQKVLPVGLSDDLRTSRVKVRKQKSTTMGFGALICKPRFVASCFLQVFCPKCEEVYLPKYRNINIDGAYFGTTFPHLFLQSYKEATVLPPKIYQYEPKIHGFKIYKKKGSKYFDGGRLSPKKKLGTSFES